MQGKSKTLI